MSVTVVVKNGASTVGEGPHWEEATQTLLYVDILEGDVHRWNSITGQDEKIHLDASVGFVTPCQKGGYMVGLGKSLAHVDWETNTVTKLKEVDQEKNTRFNDGKCDPSGRLWAGTMGMETKPTVLEHHQGSLYSLEKDGTLKSHLDKISISNGLAWSEDNRTMFYIDSIPRKVYAFDFDITTGEISNQRTAVNFGGPDTIESLGFPDGMTSDAEGKLWVACYSAGKVIQFDCETGKELRSVQFPAKKTTSCCFGGKNFDELYVTCAKTGLTELEFQTHQPLAGSVFKVTGLGVKGKPMYVYEG
ncbi:hypothetical protein ACJMK2_041625 [Sinanodonta woodiana]|uniref:Regucalcin n=1 Tax=Sinanodonta woodiana TaxID=1069815 RepID=A0ABD3W7P6_SINWO